MFFLFPFEKIERGSRVILYGGGNVGRSYYEQCICTDWCKIVLWVDRNSLVLKKQGYFRVESLDKLVEIDNDSFDYVVIAIDDHLVANSIKGQLSERFGLERIVWRRATIGSDYDGDLRRERIQLSNLIDTKAIDDDIEEKSVSLSKIKVRFFFMETYFWNVYESVAIEFLKDEKYDVLIIGCGYDIVPRYEEQKKLAEKAGLAFIPDYQYEIKKDTPDIAFVCMGAGFITKHIRQTTKLVVGIHGGLTKWFRVSAADHIKNVRWQMGANPDIFIWDKHLYKEYEQEGVLTKEHVLIGNPKFDQIFNCMREKKKYPRGWEKLKGKKVFFWTTDHQYLLENVTFDIYAKIIIEFFRNHKELGLIFRPHPMYIQELVRAGFWSENDILKLKEFLKQTENMIWDDTESYKNAYPLSDAILADYGCGITVSSLPLEIPVATLYRNTTIRVSEPRILDTTYKVFDEKSLIDFFYMVCSGKDPNKEERRRVMNETINHYDGLNGKRIKDYVEEAYRNLNIDNV